MNLYISDLHFGHTNVIRFDNRPFADRDEMDHTMIELWNGRVQPDDTVYILGDLCYRSGRAPEWYLKQLKGHKFLVLGNHDMNNVNQGFMKRFEYVAMQMLIEFGKQRIYLNHYPFLCYGGSYRGTWELFGHVHTSPCNSGLDNSRLDMLFPTQYDVGVDNNNFTPVSYGEVEMKIKDQIEAHKLKSQDVSYR